MNRMTSDSHESFQPLRRLNKSYALIPYIGTYANGFLMNAAKTARVRQFISNLKGLVVGRQPPSFQINDLGVHKSEVLNLQGWEIRSIWAQSAVILLMCVHLLEIVYHSLVVGYLEFRLLNAHFILSIFFTGIALLNIALNCLISRQYEDRIRTNIIDIIYAYRHTELLLDLVVLVLLCLNIFFWEMSAVLLIPKVVQAYNSMKRVYQSLIDTEMKQNWWNLFSFLIVNLILVNFVAIIFNAMTELNPASSWQKVNGVDTKQWFQRFVWCNYFSMTTLMTVGYGDFKAQNYYEAAIITLIELIGGMLFAYNLSSISGIIANMSRKRQELDKKMRVARNFINSNKESFSNDLGPIILHSVKSNIKATWGLDAMELSQIIGNLEEQVRRKLLIRIRLNLINDLQFFKGFSLGSKQEICQLMNSKVFLQGQRLPFPRRNLASSIFVSLWARIHPYTKVGEDLVRVETKKESKIFGLFSMLSNLPQQFIYKVQKVGQIFEIKTQELQAVLKANKHDNQLLCYHQQNASLFRRYFADPDCDYCPGIKHSLLRCPKFHYIPLKRVRMIEHAEGRQQRRIRICRARARKPSYLSFFGKVGNDQLGGRERHVTFCVESSHNLPEQVLQERLERFERCCNFKDYFFQYNAQKQLKRINERVQLNLLNRRSFVFD